MKKKQSSSFSSMVRNVVEKKGFYIALFSLTLLVGFSIYARRIQINRQQDDLSFDDAAWQQALEESGVEFRGTAPASENDEGNEADANLQQNASETADIDTESKVTEKTETVDEITSSEVIDVSTPEPDSESDSIPVFAETATITAPQTNPEEMMSPCTGEVTTECSLNDLVYCSTMSDWRTHNGMDIAGDEGTPVVAAAAGTVAQVYEDEMLGVIVTIDHGNGITSLYGNLQSTGFIHAGTAVQKGELIGGIGTPGALEADKGAHLHFEVYKDGELVNPSDFIVS